MKLSIVMPVYNEEKTILNIVDRVMAAPVEKELIVVDDCSDDGTPDALEKIRDKYPEVKILRNSSNRGKGYAVRRGFEVATGDVFLIQDADLEYDPNDYSRITGAFLKEGVQVVYGSRFLGRCENMLFAQLVANKFFNLLTNLINGTRLTDACTCYKSFKADVIRNLPLESEGFGICHELTAKISKKDLAITEVPLNYRARTWKEGKKAGYRSFFTTAAAILRFGLARSS